MKCWLLYNHSDAQKNKYYIDMYFEQCRCRNIDIMLIICDNAVFFTESGILKLKYENSAYDIPDFAVNRTRDFRISKILEDFGVKVFNNSYVTQICNDKMLTISLMAKNGIPVCDTALNGFIFKEPFVIKSLDGHGGNEVFLSENENTTKNFISKIGKPFLTQKKVSDVGKDLRVYVIGKEIIASMLRTNKNDFRSNFSLGGNAEIYTLSSEEKFLVKKIINFFDFGLVGIDFIFDRGKIILNEIEDVVGARMLYQNTDVDIVSLYFDYIEAEITKGN